MTDTLAMKLPPERRPTVPEGPRTPWEPFLSEMIGPGLLLLGGLSLVIYHFDSDRSGVFRMMSQSAARKA